MGALVESTAVNVRSRARQQWWVMHHSRSPHRKTMVATCYLDESATDGGSPIAVVGGVILESGDYELLAEEWSAMLDQFSIRPSLHRKDYGLHGRFVSMPSGKKSDVFASACSIIKTYRAYTISVTLSSADYRESLSDISKSEHSLYELCCLGAIVSNGKMAAANNCHEPIALMLDSGNPFADQVRQAHKEAERYSKLYGIPGNVGSMTFQNDEDVPALQAADIVCWAARRKVSGSRFFTESKPMEELIDNESSHQSVSLGRDILQILEPMIKHNIETRGTRE